MSDNTSVIDAVRLIAKAIKEDSDKVSDIVKGALHPEQIDDMRIMLSRARSGSLLGTATSSAAAAAPADTAGAGAMQRDTSVQRRQWKANPNKASAKYQGIPPPNTEANFPSLSSLTPTCRSANRAASRPRASRREKTLTLRYSTPRWQLWGPMRGRYTTLRCRYSAKGARWSFAMKPRRRTSTWRWRRIWSIVSGPRYGCHPGHPLSRLLERRRLLVALPPPLLSRIPDKLPLCQVTADRPATPRLEERTDTTLTRRPLPQSWGYY